MKMLTLALIFLSVPSIRGEEPQPAPPPVIFPMPPAPPIPPAPAGTPLKLDAGQLLVIRCPEKSCIVLTSPDGYVSGTTKAIPGPVTLGGVFVGGDGTFQIRTFTDKYLYVLAAVKPGQVEILAIPDGTKDAAGVTRQQLLVGGAGPTPPPPGPTPIDPLVQAFQAAYGQSPDPIALLKATSIYSVLAQTAKLHTEIKTLADALQWERKLVQDPSTGLGVNQLVPLRKAIAAELLGTFGSKATDPVDLDKLAAEFDRIATALGRVAK